MSDEYWFYLVIIGMLFIVHEKLKIPWLQSMSPMIIVGMMYAAYKSGWFGPTGG